MPPQAKHLCKAEAGSWEEEQQAGAEHSLVDSKIRLTQ